MKGGCQIIFICRCLKTCQKRTKIFHHKTPRTEIATQNSVAFLYTNNECAGEKSRKIMPYSIPS